MDKVQLVEIADISKSMTECIKLHSPPNNSIEHEGPRIYYRTESQCTKDNDDDVRHRNSELLWTEKIEDAISAWMSNCVIFANAHKENAKYYKTIFCILGLPATIIPMVLASMTETLTEDYTTITVILLILMSILNAIIGFIDPGKLAEAHLNFEALYNELSVEITSELIKPRQNRQEADVFIQRIMDRYNSLNNRAPN